MDKMKKPQNWINMSINVTESTRDSIREVAHAQHMSVKSLIMKLLIENEGILPSEEDIPKGRIEGLHNMR